MSIYDSKLWIDNIDTVINEFPEFHELECKSVLITGAAGLICSAIVDILIRYNETHSEKIEIIVAGRSEYSCAMKSHFRKFGNQMSGSGNHLCNYASLLA